MPIKTGVLHVIKDASGNCKGITAKTNKGVSPFYEAVKSIHL
jgi:hypothetical protein